VDVGDRILTAAASCVRDFGVHRVTLAEIARRAGVSRPTVYRRWPDTQTILAALLTDRIIGAWREVPMRGTGRDALVRRITAVAGRLRRDELIRTVLRSAPELAMVYISDRLGTSQQMLIDVGLGRTIANASQLVELSPLLLGWFTAVIIRLATGSATVATVTAGGLMAATISVNPDLNPALLVLAIGAGSMFFSHINDAGFWMVKEFMGMSMPDMFKTWTMVSNIISVSGIILVLALSQFI
jgi:AcrR family transcriptional regulator